MATIAEQLTSLANTKTAIKDAIIAKGVEVTDTDPFSAYPAKIGEISGGGGAPATKFGASVDTFIGDVDENGVLQAPTVETVLDFTGVKEIGEKTLYYFMQDRNSAITSVLFPSLERVDSSGLSNAFYESKTIKNANFVRLKTVGSGGMTYVFYGARELSSPLDFRLLEEIGDNGFRYAFYYCVKAPYINLSSLKTLKTGALQYAFGYVPVVKMSFPSLTDASVGAYGSDPMAKMFSNCKELTEVHFRIDAQATLEALPDYSEKWGATNATIYFDLIGTITVNGVAYARNEPNSIYVDDAKTYVAWADESGNIVYTDATAEPAVDTVVYSDAGTTQVGTVEEVA